MHTQNPIIGRSSGSAAGMTFCTINGKNVVKAKNKAQKKTKTASQIKHMTLFQSYSKLAALLNRSKAFLFLSKPLTASYSALLVSQVSRMFDKTNPIPTLLPGYYQIGNGLIPITLTMDDYDSQEPKVRFAVEFGYTPSALLLSCHFYGIIIDWTDKKVLKAGFLAERVEDAVVQFDSYIDTVGHQYMYVVSAIDTAPKKRRQSLKPACYVIKSPL